MGGFFNKPFAEPIETLGLMRGRVIDITQHPEWFYKYKNGDVLPYYKDDIKKKINVFIPKTFLPILQELDIPFYEQEWLFLIERQMINGQDLSNVLGKYIAKMKLHDFKPYGFKDSTNFFTCFSSYENFKYIPKITFMLDYYSNKRTVDTKILFPVKGEDNASSSGLNE